NRTATASPIRLATNSGPISSRRTRARSRPTSSSSPSSHEPNGWTRGARPAAPAGPAEPDEPVTPEAPAEPEEPAEPGMPGVPGGSGVPTVPAVSTVSSTVHTVSLQHDQQIPAFHLLHGVDGQPLDGARLGRGDGRLHLHRLDGGHGVALLDL